MKRKTFREFLNENQNFWQDVGLNLFESSDEDFVSKKELKEILSDYVKITSIEVHEDNTITITWEE